MRIVVCGENLIDMIPQEIVSPAESHWAALSGGGPLNTAVALAKLGTNSQFLGRLGVDSFGAQIERHLSTNGVGLDLAVRSADPTTLAVVSLDDEGKASYYFHFNGTAGFSWRPEEFPALEPSDWLHFGSIGFVVGSGVEPLRDFVAGTKAALSFDLNIRPTVIPDRSSYLEMVWPLIESVGKAGGILKASDEDIEWLADTDDPLGTARAWLDEVGASMFLITLGADGALALLPGGEEVRVPGRRVELVDTVGAGDTFMAGFLMAWTQDQTDIAEALRTGVAASALVCTRKGANPPTRSELDAFLTG